MNFERARAIGVSVGCSLLIFYMFTGSWVLAGALALAATLVLFKGIEFYAQQYGNLIFKRGGKAARTYSELQALAKNGGREEACRRLLEIFSKDSDPEALRVCLKIAIGRPLLGKAAMSACQRLLSHPKVPAADKEEYRRILAEVAPDATGAKHEIGSSI